MFFQTVAMKSFFVLGCSMLAAAQIQAAPRKPNIIFILCDDMGYGDLGCYGQKLIRTPNIDRMAAEGMRFTQAYAGCPVSAPSRASLQTGQHTGHCYIRGNKEHWTGEVTYGVVKEYAVTGQEPYDTAHVILPQIMKEHGYSTGMFGKWAGGYEGSRSTPDKMGVDEFYGPMCQYTAHSYFPNFINAYSRAEGDTAVGRIVLEQNVQFPLYGNASHNRRQYSADMIHERAMAWIDRMADEGKPFFGLFTYTIPHAELNQPHDSIYHSYDGQFTPDKSYGGSEGARYNPVECEHQEFAAMITRLDAYVGQIVQKLKERGVAENTLIIFSSDNGPHEEGGADPEFFGRDGKLRGIKRSTYEGGIRVPFICYWPGTITAGQVSDHQCVFYDILPTFCDLIGQKNYVRRYSNRRLENDWFDGISFASTLLGKSRRQQKHDFLYWELNPMIGVRMGDWKMVVNRGKVHLYNLATDLHEDNDVSLFHPDVVDKMKDIIRREHVDSEIFPLIMPK